MVFLFNVPLAWYHHVDVLGGRDSRVRLQLSSFLKLSRANLLKILQQTCRNMLFY